MKMELIDIINAIVVKMNGKPFNESITILTIILAKLIAQLMVNGLISEKAVRWILE